MIKNGPLCDPPVPADGPILGIEEAVHANAGLGGPVPRGVFVYGPTGIGWRPIRGLDARP